MGRRAEMIGTGSENVIQKLPPNGISHRGGGGHRVGASDEQIGHWLLFIASQHSRASAAHSAVGLQHAVAPPPPHLLEWTAALYWEYGGRAKKNMIQARIV